MEGRSKPRKIAMTGYNQAGLKFGVARVVLGGACTVLGACRYTSGHRRSSLPAVVVGISFLLEAGYFLRKSKYRYYRYTLEDEE